jgi:hypothetical protein
MLERHKKSDGAHTHRNARSHAQKILATDHRREKVSIPTLCCRRYKCVLSGPYACKIIRHVPSNLSICGTVRLSGQKVYRRIVFRYYNRQALQLVLLLKLTNMRTSSKIHTHFFP